MGAVYRQLMEIESRLLPCGLHTIGKPPTAEEAVATAARVGVVRSGDTVVVVSGSSAETHATDTLRVLRVP